MPYPTLPYHAVYRCRNKPQPTCQAGKAIRSEQGYATRTAAAWLG